MLRREFFAGALASIVKPGTDLSEIAYAFQRTDQVVLAGAHRAEKPLLVPEGRTLIGANAVVTAVADMPGTTTRQMIHGSSNSRIRNLGLDGGGFQAGGVCMTGADWTVEEVTASNCGDAQALQAIGTQGGIFRFVRADQALHGLQLWRCEGTRVEGAKVTRMKGGGIWGADLKAVRVVGGSVADCGDVGLDFEGGEDCEGRGVFVTRCRFGELTFFKNAVEPSVGCQDIRFNECRVVRQSTYNLGYDVKPCEGGHGAVDFSSLSANSSGIKVSNCHLDVRFGVAYGFHEVPAGCEIDLHGNRETLALGVLRSNGKPQGCDIKF